MSTSRPSLEELIALGGFVDTRGVLLILVPDPESLDKFGQPMYQVIFMPPHTSLQVLKRSGNLLNVRVLGCDFTMGDEDHERLDKKIKPHECICGFIDLEGAI